MKTDLKVKYLQYLNQRKQSDEGFTLIELLVVIIIIGILAAIALPSFLNQANKARASEAKSYIGSLNRAQQAYILENPNFVTQQADFSKLGLGISTQTQYYTYKIAPLGTTGATQKATPTTLPANPPILKGYAGAVTTGKTKGVGNEATSLAVICETLNPQTSAGTDIVDPVPDAAAPNTTKINCDTSKQKELR